MDAGLAKAAPGRKARFAGMKNQLRQKIRRKAPKIIGDQLRSDAAPQEVMPGGLSGEVRPTASGSDAGAFAPGS